MSLCLQVRSGRPGDLAAMLLVALGSPTAPQWPAAEYERILASHPAADRAAYLHRTAFVAEGEAGVMGFAVASALTLPPVEVELESVAVAERHRRQGVGRALLQGIVRWGMHQSAQSVRLEVRAGNIAALQLYAAFGFAQTGRRKGYYTHPDEDAVCLQLILPPAFHAGQAAVP